MAPVQKLGNIDLKKRTSQKFAFGFFTLLSYLVVAILFVILGFIIIKGGSVISWDFLTKAPEEGMTKGGIFPAIVGTFYLIVGSSIISFPIGIMSGIYMNEYATNGKVVRFIRIMTNNLSGVPSVVFGLFGMSLFVNALGWGDSIIAGSFTLALMSLPLIIRTTEEALKSIRVVLPMAFPNIITGLILSVGRVSGETAPILFTVAAYFLPQLPGSIFDQCMALPYHLYVISTSGTDIEASRGMAYGTALVLIAIVLVVNLLANLLRNYFAKKVKMN